MAKPAKLLSFGACSSQKRLEKISSPTGPLNWVETQCSHLGMLQLESSHPVCPSLNCSQQLSVVFRSLSRAYSAGATAHAGGLTSLTLASFTSASSFGLVVTLDLGRSDSGLLSLESSRDDVAGHAYYETNQS